MSKQVIIIGAGPAGLTAAYKLLTETDYKPIILEESNEIGGISRTVVHNGNRMDIGGHRFFSKDDSVVNFWTSVMAIQGKHSKDDLLLNREKPLENGGPDPEIEDEVLLVRQRVSRIYFLKRFFDYPISLNLSTLKNMGLKNTLKVGFGYIKSMVFKKPEDSLENFYINRFGKPLYEMFFRDYTTKLWGISPKEISADWGAQRVKGLSLSKALFSFFKKTFSKKQNEKNTETSLIEQFIYPKKGPGQLWELVAEKIVEMGGEIKLNTKVTEINTENSTITSVTACFRDEKIDFSGDCYISSMPIKDLICSINAKSVPQDVLYVAENLPYRDFITVGVLADKLKIKNQTKIKTLSNIVPDCWIYIQEKDVKIGRLQIFNNWSPYMVKDPINTVWIGLEYFCTENDEMWNMSDKDFIEMAVAELEHIGIVDKSDVKDTTRIKVKKAYPAYFGVYKDFDKVKSYLDSFSNLYCVGRNGQHRYNNMDHSMLTSFAAVDCIKTNNSDRSAVWNVNTEQTYHEKK